MKKITLFLLLAIGIASSPYSQTLKIITPGDNNILNDSTVVIYGDTGTQLTSTFWIINSGSNSMDVKARRDSISWLPLQKNEICWAGTCYSYSTTISPTAETIAAGDTAKLGSQFNGDYFPMNEFGTSIFRYTFYNPLSPADSSWVIVHYVTVVTEIAAISDKSINFSAPYPNPASNLVNFTYNFSKEVQVANLKIYNVLGECVQTLPLSSSRNRTTINVGLLPSGIYMCEIKASGCNPVYQKLIVAH